MFSNSVGALIGGGIILALGLLGIPVMVESLTANEVMVIQSITGDLNCYTEPGPKFQGMGTVTTYPRRGTYIFDRHVVNSAGVVTDDNGKQLQFNDGGTATLYGTVNWEMPLDCKQIIAIHRTFNSQAGVEAQGVARMVNLAIQLSGSTMTSLESFAERKGELIEIINDQAQNGAYQMVTKQVERADIVTGEKKMVSAAEIVRSRDGHPVRQQASILDQFGIHLQPMSIERLVYSKIVNDQIEKRQEATTAVQVSQAQALKAIQAAITAEKEGQATAAKAKWEQETIKAKVVTEAQQRLEIATLDAQSAAQYKREQILRGEGDAERRRLVMSADGALDKKLEAYVAVNTVWATNFGKFTGQLVPQVNLSGGGPSGNAVSGITARFEVLAAKTARDMALDPNIIGGKK